MVPAAVSFIRDLKRPTNQHKWKVLGNVLDHCMRYDQSIPKPSTIRDDKWLNSVLEGLWRGAGQGPFGLYCAEPKAYFYTRNSELVPTVSMIAGVRQETFEQYGVVQGSLAVWYSGSGREFSANLLVYGPEVMPGSRGIITGGQSSSRAHITQQQEINLHVAPEIPG